MIILSDQNFIFNFRNIQTIDRIFVGDRNDLRATQLIPQSHRLVEAA
jgi:hypothetical protein